jgi:hypothetical protein
MTSKLFLAVFALVHFATSVWLSLKVFTLGMARLDSGTRPTLPEIFLEHLSHILLSPIFTLLARSDIAIALLPGPLGLLPVLANSALWAVCAWWLVRLLGSIRIKGRNHGP